MNLKSIFKSKSFQKPYKQNKNKIKSFLIKALLVVASTIAIVYFMPRDTTFNYTYDINKPWRYGQLIATFKFPIYKSDSLLRREQDSIMKTFQPYYNIDKKIKEQITTKLQATKLANADNNIPNLSAYINHVEQLAYEVYDKGVLSSEDLDLINKKGLKSIRLVDGVDAMSVQVSTLYSTRSAYEYIMSKDSLKYSRTILQSLNINELIQPNVTYDMQKSKAEEEALKSTISGASGFVVSGQKIIDRGEIVTKETYEILKSLEKEYDKHADVTENIPYRLIGMTVIVFLILAILMSYLSLFRADYLENYRNCTLLFALIILFSIIPSEMVSRNFMNVFMIPFCMVPIIIRIFMDSRTAFMFHCGMIIIVSLILRYPYEFVILQLLLGMIAIQNLRELSQRSQIIRTAAFLTIGYIVFYTAYEMIIENEIGKIEQRTLIYFTINGLLLLFTYPLLWLLEKAFGFVSDVTLVELSNINHPLLQRMSEIAPGTFQHSMQVANLASEVAKKIKARVQLVRTGALYHDIGKMERPVFFTENQVGRSPHNHLSPEKSAEVIIAHVKNGITLADKYNLPEVIKGFIVTHHGLGKTKYFYITYKNQHPDEVVDESKFTYPGPNPYTKEQAILMMADSVEAASRSLPEYTEESISNLVDRIIDGQVTDGNFRDCPITFRDIAIAKNVFKERLKTVYHTRISYPELNAAAKEKEEARKREEEAKAKEEEETLAMAEEVGAEKAKEAISEEKQFEEKEAKVEDNTKTAISKDPDIADKDDKGACNSDKKS